MMDFTDLTTVVKKTTKKATDLAMRPVKLVTDPIIEANKKLKNTVFGPDLVLLSELTTREQLIMLDTHYAAYLTKVTQALRTKKVATKKIEKFIHACKLIAAAPAPEGDLEAHTDLMQELLDELRFVCKEGLPIGLKEKIFSLDKKSKFTSEEFDAISDQIAAVKKELNQIVNKLESDMTQLRLTRHPDAAKLITDTQASQTKLVDTEKAYNDLLWSLISEIKKGKSTISEIITHCESIRKIKTKETNSLFSPERKKIKGYEKDYIEKIKKVVSKEFPKRYKDYGKSAETVSKKHKEIETNYTVTTAHRMTFFKAWKSWADGYRQESTNAKKNFSRTSKALTSTASDHLDQLGKSYKTWFGKIVKPYDNEKLFDTSKEQMDKLHTGIHTDQLLIADNTWKTGTSAELPVLAQLRLVERRESYLVEHISTVRGEIIYTKMALRLYDVALSLMKSYREKLDDHKVYADGLLKTPIAQLQDALNKLQESIKTHEKTLKTHEKTLSDEKQELWDGINFKRLVDLQRTRYQDNTYAQIGALQSGQVKAEHGVLKTQLTVLQTFEKDLAKQHRLDLTAIDEQEKTVTILKTKEQKDKLARLKKQVILQEFVAKKLHQHLDTLTSHVSEISSLEKKYTDFGKDHEAHADRYKKLATEISKNLTKSPLKQWVAGDTTFIDMF